MTGEGLQILTHARYLWSLNIEYSCGIPTDKMTLFGFLKIKYSLFKQSYKCQIIGNETKHSYYYMYIHKEVVT